MRKCYGLGLLSLLVAATAFGQAQKAASKTYVLKAARLFDGKSNALVTPGVVVVTDGKVVAAGTSAAIPAGAEVMDLGDATPLAGSSSTVRRPPEGSGIPANLESPAKFRVRAGAAACLLYTSPSPRDLSTSRMPSSA